MKSANLNRNPGVLVVDPVRSQAIALGARIRAARVRRGLRREDLAARAGLSRTAVEAVEAGKLTTGLGTYLQALWAMGLGEELALVADAGLDRDGLALELNARTKRVRVQQKGLDNEF
jgi:transcriptional regulator with XRE-family HTH domain